MWFSENLDNAWYKYVLVLKVVSFVLNLWWSSLVLQNPGTLKIQSGGIFWKKQGGGKAVEVQKADILGVTWTKVPRTNQLGVRIKDGLNYKFTGFRDQVIPPSFFFCILCSMVALQQVHMYVFGETEYYIRINIFDEVGSDRLIFSHLRIRNILTLWSLEL